MKLKLELWKTWKKLKLKWNVKKLNNNPNAIAGIENSKSLKKEKEKREI